jgi:allophanate hydrolase subunit 2
LSYSRIAKERSKTVEYKVLPFAPDVSEAEDQHQALAAQLQTLINQQAAEGWKFVRIESTSIVTTAPAQAGCFGMLSMGGGGGSSIMRFDVAVFEK